MNPGIGWGAFLYIFLGGGLGSVLRYYISFLANRYLRMGAFPLGTFLVNIIGCLLIGYFAGYFLKHDYVLKFLLITGFCGGFTTFSTFSLESFNLWQQGRTGVLALYVGLSLVVGFVAVATGMLYGKN